MPSVVVVDSNIYISLLRKRIDPITKLGQWAGEDTDLAICGMIMFEVLRGVRTTKARSVLQRFFDTFIMIPTTQEIWYEATDIAWKLDRKGTVIPSSDALIAACARQVGAAILTDDRHFLSIPHIRVIHPDGLF